MTSRFISTTEQVLKFIGSGAAFGLILVVKRVLGCKTRAKGQANNPPVSSEHVCVDRCILNLFECRLDSQVLHWRAHLFCLSNGASHPPHRSPLAAVYNQFLSYSEVKKVRSFRWGHFHQNTSGAQELHDKEPTDNAGVYRRSLLLRDTHAHLHI